MIDTHCHLADDAFATDLPEVIARAHASGVDRALCILAAHVPAEIVRAIEVRRLWPEVRFAVGIHPHAAGEFVDRAVDAATTTDRAIDQVGDVVAIGEIGLDHHYDLAPRAVQRDVFAAQVDLAVRRALPVVIHTREAMPPTIEVLREAGRGRVRGVIHCFTGSPEDARAALDLGFYISFAGMLTFPKSGALRDTAALVPLDRVLVETDSPYLAPVPHRGKRNEPAWVTSTLAELARLHRTAASDLEGRIVENSAALFGGGA